MKSEQQKKYFLYKRARMFKSLGSVKYFQSDTQTQIETNTKQLEIETEVPNTERKDVSIKQFLITDVNTISNSYFSNQNTSKKPKNHRTSSNFDPISKFCEETSKIYIEKISQLENIINRQTCFQTQSSIDFKDQTNVPISKSNQGNIDFLSEYQETRIQVDKNVFVYAKLNIKDKPSPVQITFQIRDGPARARIRIFASSQSSIPNRFNCDIETQGRMLKFADPKGNKHFQDKTLYLTILSKEDILLGVEVDFNKTLQAPPRIFLFKNVNKSSVPPNENLFDLISEILEKRKKKYQRRLDYIALNKQTNQYEPRQKLNRIESNKVNDNTRLNLCIRKISKKNFSKIN